MKLFVRDDCPASPAARRACEGIVNLSIYDLDNVEGLAAASILGVNTTPSVVVVDSSGREIAAWRGVAPAPAEIRAVLAN